MAVIGVKSITGITSITNAAGGADVLTFHSNNTTERVRIKSDGEVLIGTTTDRPIAGQRFASNQGWGGSLQLEKANPSAGNNSVPFFAITAWNGANEQYTGGISFNRSNNNTQGTHGAVNTNQQLGNISFNGSDGTNFIQGAEIFAIPDQSFATNDGPTALVFGTVPDGTSETRPQERLRIASTGEVWCNAGLLKLGSTSGQDSIIHTTNAAGILYRADENGHKFQTYVGGWQNRLTIKDDGNIEVSTTTDTAAHYLKFNANRSSDGDHLGGIYGVWNGNSVGAINILAGPDTTNKDDGHLQFITYTGGTAYERLRITAAGATEVKGDLYVKNTYPRIYLLDTDSNSDFSLINDNGNFSIYDDSNSAHRLRITSTGQIQQDGTSGLSYFKGSSEYIFGSNTSSPPAGGSEANVQIHAYKTRAQFSINAYMNNGGGPFMQFISSRSGTVGTLGTKCQNNDYLGEIRFMGDNGTNYNSLCQGASIYAQAASTPADGDTTIGGELYFTTGTGSAGTQPVRLTLDSGGRATFTGEVHIPTKLVHDGDQDTNINFGTNTITINAGNRTAINCNSTMTEISSPVQYNNSRNYTTNSTSSWTTIFTFSVAGCPGFSFECGVRENNYTTIHRVGGSAQWNSCYSTNTFAGDSGHSHSKDITFRVLNDGGTKRLQFKAIQYTTTRTLSAISVWVASGYVTWA